MDWTDLEKVKPEHGQQVLITDGVHIAVAEVDAVFNKDGSVWWDICNVSGHDCEWAFDDRFITHWMPLPKLPEDSNLREKELNFLGNLETSTKMMERAMYK